MKGEIEINKTEEKNTTKVSTWDIVCLYAFYTLFFVLPFVYMFFAFYVMVRCFFNPTRPLVILLTTLALPWLTITIFFFFGPLRRGSRSKLVTDNFLIRGARRALGARMELDNWSHSSDNSKNYVFCVHPHGPTAIERVVFWGCAADNWDKTFPGVDTRDLVASSLLLAPIARIVCFFTGCIPAGRQDTLSAAKRNSILLYPGGEKEQLLYTNCQHDVYVSRRKGICRIALERGLTLVPVYVFGATDQYHTSKFLSGFRNFVQNKLRVAIPVFWGNSPFWFPWVPRHEKPLVAVFGTPIENEVVETPSQEQIDQLHERYVKGLVDVFNRNKERLGYPNDELIIH